MGREQDRRAAIAKAQIELNKKLVYLDTETTGLKDHDQIVEICLIDNDGAVLIDSLVKPTVKIPLDATRVHGITDAMVSTAPTWPEMWPQLEPIFAERRIAIYNADYDLRLMQQSHRAHGLTWQTTHQPLLHHEVVRSVSRGLEFAVGQLSLVSLDDARWQCRSGIAQRASGQSRHAVGARRVAVCRGGAESVIVLQTKTPDQLDRAVILSAPVSSSAVLTRTLYTSREVRRSSCITRPSFASLPTMVASAASGPAGTTMMPPSVPSSKMRSISPRDRRPNTRSPSAMMAAAIAAICGLSTGLLMRDRPSPE